MRKQQTPTPTVPQILQGLVTEGFIAECSEAENGLLIWLVASCAQNSMNAELRIVRPTAASYFAVRGLHQKGILNRVDGLYNGWSVKEDLPFLAGQRLTPVILQSDEKPTPSAATERDAISALWNSVTALVLKGDSVLLVDPQDAMLPLMKEFAKNHPQACFVLSKKFSKDFLKPLVVHIKEQPAGQTIKSSDAANSTVLSLRASSETLATAIVKAVKGMGITLLATGVETLTQGTARTLGILTTGVTVVISVRDREAAQRVPEGFRVVEVPTIDKDLTSNTKDMQHSERSMVPGSASQTKTQKDDAKPSALRRRGMTVSRHGRPISQNDDHQGNSDADEERPATRSFSNYKTMVHRGGLRRD